LAPGKAAPVEAPAAVRWALPATRRGKEHSAARAADPGAEALQAEAADRGAAVSAEVAEDTAAVGAAEVVVEEAAVAAVAEEQAEVVAAPAHAAAARKELARCGACNAFCVNASIACTTVSTTRTVIRFSTRGRIR
jgi:hypothetical protein